ncbi:MAG: hypothetical protein ACW987_08970 [Candidatus Thorarchaeota archaeon]|jgi:hypothetical protein
MPGANSSRRTVLNPPRETTQSQDLSVDKLSVTTTTTRPFALNYVTFNTNSPTVQTLTIRANSISGSAFDTTILKEKICLTDFIYQPDKEMTFPKDAQVTVEVTNSGIPVVMANVVISTQEI